MSKKKGHTWAKFFENQNFGVQKVDKKKTRRTGFEPAYSDYEPDELPITQPPRIISVKK